MPWATCRQWCAKTLKSDQRYYPPSRLLLRLKSSRTRYPTGLRLNNPYHICERQPNSPQPRVSLGRTALVDLDDEYEKGPPPHVRPTFSSTPDLLPGGQASLRAVPNFSFQQSQGSSIYRNSYSSRRIAVEIRRFQCLH